MITFRTYPNFPQFEVAGHNISAGTIDHSYGFLWWEKRDVWFDLVNDPRKIRYVKASPRVAEDLVLLAAVLEALIFYKLLERIAI